VSHVCGFPVGPADSSHSCSSSQAYATVAVDSTAYAPMDAIATSKIMAYLVLFIGMTLVVQYIMGYAKVL
jgi:hypothetical protein